MLCYYQRKPLSFMIFPKAMFYMPEIKEQNNLPRCFHREWMEAFSERLYNLNRLMDKLEDTYVR